MTSRLLVRCLSNVNLEFRRYKIKKYLPRKESWYEYKPRSLVPYTQRKDPPVLKFGEQTLPVIDSEVTELHGLWEPNDLKLVPDIPEYQRLNIRIQGYDYPVVEHFAKRVNRTMKNIFNVENKIVPFQSQVLEVQRYAKFSNAAEEVYHLQKYERVVEMENIPVNTVPVMLQMLQKVVPFGVQLTVKEATAEDDERKFIPDYDVRELERQKQIIISGERVKKKRFQHKKEG